MHTEPRAGGIFKIVLHTNEGPEGENSAQGLATYLLNNGPDGGGYQVTFDDHHTITVQPDNVVCWANGGVNHESIDGCIVGYAAQTPAEWDDAFDRGAIEQAAQWFAAKCTQYGIPARRLTPQEVATPGARGICGHGDVTLAGFPGSQGHTDPGPNFPWPKFLARINVILDGATPVPIAVDSMEQTMMIQTHHYDPKTGAMTGPTTPGEGHDSTIAVAADGSCLEARQGASIAYGQSVEGDESRLQRWYSPQNPLPAGVKFRAVCPRSGDAVDPHPGGVALLSNGGTRRFHCA
jgi:hypothetical protein